ncbi:uncharacterized protein A4U43_C02F1710 [Asparagus officinalis]|uniref:Uncharacterized protein n=1 Tax=Asparagus officinalis TaxID=4686 RepID=A0A5P1FGW0_ASPOF|nr:cation/H(+) antiporter 20 [Asparagus officinalis]ONK76963.1 uncharacterized protein A4U43_C02F1710 [Asparagus officinalis]
MSTTNITAIRISSDGAWQGENPLNYALPLLVIQTTLVLLLSRSIAFFLKPLRQPKVVAEILGGIVLGPSALGRWKPYLHTIFPSWSCPVLETVSSIGLLFFLFLIGLELDINSIRRSGRKAFGIAAAGILLPFLSGIGIVFVLRKTVSGAPGVGFFQLLVFIGVSLSITAFPVLARILAELKLLTTDVGETAMAAAAFNDVAAWVLLALAVALSGGQHKSPLVSLWILLSGVLFTVFMMTVIRPVMAWIARQSSPENRATREMSICLTLVGVLVSGLMTDFIGIHSIFGAFMFGLTIPKEGKFAEKLFERIEDFVSELMLPLYFASSGLKTDVAKIQGAEAWGLLVLVTATACIGKIVGTFVVAVSSKIPARKAATLGVLMGTKGLVELIVLNIGKEKKVLNDETFTILVLMALFTTFITTPVVLAINKPTGDAYCNYNPRLQSDSSLSLGKRDLRILACLHNSYNVPSIINLIEMIRGSDEMSRLKLYVLQLVELTERPSSIFTALRARKNGKPAHDSTKLEGCSNLDQVMAGFEVYEKLGRAKIRSMTAISALATMHEDVCHVAEEKRVSFLILPFHKHWVAEDDEEVDDVGHEWKSVYQRVLAHCPCSVGLFIDRGFSGPTFTEDNTRICGVCILFFGGPDDRKALELGIMMLDNPNVRLTLIRFVQEEKNSPLASEQEQDDKNVAEFRRKSKGLAVYEEKRVDIFKKLHDLCQNKEYELLVVGRRASSRLGALNLGKWWGKHTELGPVGNNLTSQGLGVVSSLLVVQQHCTVNSCNLIPLTSMDGNTMALTISPNISASV